MPRISSTTAVKQPSVANRRVRSKPAWSDYLTEDNRFALTKAEVLRRKKTLLSKNNDFNSVTKISSGTTNHQKDHPKASANFQRFAVADVGGEDDATFPKKSLARDALDFVSKKSICW